jgi:hypothetical protein
MFKKASVVQHVSRKVGEVRTVVVCLPDPVPPIQLPVVAGEVLAANGIGSSGPVAHFQTRVRFRSGRLVDLWQERTSGGPVRLLDLAMMQQRCAQVAGVQWWLWQRVVAGTRPAQPDWSFMQRHVENPRRYPLERMRQAYMSQPRVMAMFAYNAMPNTLCPLPTGDLEAFQAGYDTYVRVAWLSAVPANGLAVKTGGKPQWLTPCSTRLCDQLGYLIDANRRIAACGRKAQLVAMGTSV